MHVRFQKESNQTEAVYHELFSALFLPAQIPYINTDYFQSRVKNFAIKVENIHVNLQNF